MTIYKQRDQTCKSSSTASPCRTYKADHNQNFSAILPQKLIFSESVICYLIIQVKIYLRIESTKKKTSASSIPPTTCYCNIYMVLNLRTSITRKKDDRNPRVEGIIQKASQQQPPPQAPKTGIMMEHDRI